MIKIDSVINKGFTKNGLSVTLETIIGEFFPTLVFKVEIDGEKIRFDYVSSSEELEKFMYINKNSTKEAKEECYYNIIL